MTGQCIVLGTALLFCVIFSIAGLEIIPGFIGASRPLPGVSILFDYFRGATREVPLE